ncbi:electron transfer flavoprotein-quinone oxidoreductase [Sporomusaceae bacterium BoRhaA]|uniref:FAD-dependent oxidoreductase n=1 Tax=Pelorhabdus rhamnosifermentans TaxID=2772457 RepID=UPI001C0640EE|nr:FAD-dependent oxidoreductase [Pelorhabdus rhamnosifermentans]MBU2700843.1 electron transfer flavoprotein-quinone oxidoreductase [Pelorhabdus rhamnosifermentans]
MSDEEKLDVIIVGGGLAGLAAAYVLAKAGKEVVLIERGTACGNKNMTGGRLYVYSLLSLLGPELLAEAPLERAIVKEQITMVSATGGMTLDYTDYSFKEGIPQSYSILRSVFDDWLAGKAEEAGAMIVTGIHVDKIMEKNGKIVGVDAAGEEMFADTVIAADGVNSFMAQQAGLRNDLTSREVGVGVKEMIELPEEVINSRFGLQAGEGATRLFVGVSNGISGGGFLYTNKSSLSLGLVVNSRGLGNQRKKLHTLMQEFKMHPAVYPLLDGGKTVEYAAHLVNELGFVGLPQQLYRDGLVVIGDAAGFVINMGNTIRGMDLAIWSGIAVAKAILEARTSAEVGPRYMENIERDLIPTMKVYQSYPKLLEIPRMFTEYPKLANDMMHYLFAVDGSVPPKLSKAMLGIVKNNVSLGSLLSDGWKGVTSL